MSDLLSAGQSIFNKSHLALRRGSRNYSPNFLSFQFLGDRAGAFNALSMVGSIAISILLVGVQAVSAQESSASMSFRAFRDCDICSEMIVLPAGNYFMGATEKEFEGKDQYKFMYLDESPQHPVDVKSFGLAKFDVTRRQFAIFAKETGFSAKGCEIFNGGKWVFDEVANWESPGFKQTDEDPVVCVSWDDANNFIKWLNTKVADKKKVYRLPNEVEWEYAARAGTTTPMYWGDDTSKQCQYENARDLSAKNLDPSAPVANCNDGYVTTAPVGSFHENPWGLYDMLGNVTQWLSNCSVFSYFESFKALLAKAPDGCRNRAARGAGWSAIPIAVRSADRSGYKQGSRTNYAGFRLAIDFQQ